MSRSDKGKRERGAPTHRLGRVARRHSLTDHVTQELSSLILSGAYSPGARLPTESEAGTHFGVSRTVIREAVARLKSSGLVESRQGSGLYVRHPNAQMLFRIDPDSIDESYESVLPIVELRRGVEVEAAALAAERRTGAQLGAIRAALAGISRAEAAGEDGVDADMEFHRAIVRAAGNPHYLAFWSFIGQFIRGAMRTTRANEARREDFAAQVRAEHKAIVDAIARGSEDAAREAALLHSEMAVVRLQEARGGGRGMRRVSSRES